MSLSRPIRFPLLKLPFLCIKCVLHNSDLFDIIYFATISNRTRRIVRNSKYPLKGIDITSSVRKIYIKDAKENDLGGWYFKHRKRGNGVPLVLQRNSQPILTEMNFHDWMVDHLHSYSAVDELDALRMGMAFLIDVFGCTIKTLRVRGNKISELFGLGISSVEVLHLSELGPVNITDLKYLLETIKATDSYLFFVEIPKDFSCDPQIFKCRELHFVGKNSADWVTMELLCQFDVPHLTFQYHQFSKEDIVSYITHWFNSDNRKLECLSVDFRNSISLEDFEIDHLNPMPFCEKRRNRWTIIEDWGKKDLSSGKDILRKDGLLATLHADRSCIFFYVWHKRFPDDVQQ